MSAPDSFAETLRRYWGYSFFRPGQEAIVRSIAAGRDTCVVMPTGGGKSLCYQLPAAMDARRTAVVISPLIALMQDQVAQLGQMGIAAAFVNSSQPFAAREEIIRRATRGEYRLLYLSPESVAQSATLDWLSKVPISCFVIDEAHCISEWGHEFRPEYRDLNRLRIRFPNCHFSAFTASATRRVRHDIIQQLGLRDPFRHIASFHRKNLRYIAKETTSRNQGGMLLQAVRHAEDGSVIIYVPTIARVQETVRFLESNGVAAIGYHGKMESAERRAAQEKWMVDEIRVIVCTIAFGLGINKPAVRSVIHLALPKGLEQYYQEAGRAGRDGLPAECVLLWRKGDAGTQAFFIKQISDEQERERAWRRYYDIRDYAESNECRQLLICRHFGETPKWERCETCDICSGVPDWLGDEAGNAVKEAPLRKSAATAGSFGTAAAGLSSSGLRESLRQWRIKVAKEKATAAFVVMHDTTLDDLCSKRPRNLEELRKVSGFGEKKTQLYGEQVLALIREDAGSRALLPPATAILSDASAETLRLLRRGMTFEQVAAARERNVASVMELAAKLIERGDCSFERSWLDRGKYDLIAEACSQIGDGRLKPVKDVLPEEITYSEIRLVVADLRAKRSSVSQTGDQGSPEDTQVAAGAE